MNVQPRRLEVSSGVHAYVQPDGSWWVSNAAFVATQEAVVLVDTCATEARTKALRAALHEVTGGREPDLIVLTHEHGDHAYGTSLFPGTPVLSSDACRTALRSAIDPHDLPPLWQPMPDWGGVRVRTPDVTVGAGTTVWAGDLAIELHPVPGRAHTTGDLVAWLPEQRVLCCGDLVFNGGTPLAAFGSVPGMLRALGWLEGFGAKVVIPGHGPVTDASVLASQRSYFEWVWEAAADGHRRGVPPLEFARQLDLQASGFAGLHDSHRIVMNLHRAYADLDAPAGIDSAGNLDPAVVAGDAVALEGGPLPCVA